MNQLIKADILRDQNLIGEARTMHKQLNYIKSGGFAGMQGFMLITTVKFSQTILKDILNSKVTELTKSINVILHKYNINKQELLNKSNPIFKLKGSRVFDHSNQEISGYLGPFFDCIQAYLNYIDNFFIKNFGIKKEFYFSEGHIKKAEIYFAKLLNKAKGSIKLQDNFLDKSIIKFIYHCHSSIKINLLTRELRNAIVKRIFANNLGNVQLRTNSCCHDRFLIIDNKEIWALGCSINGLGKKAGIISSVTTSKAFYEIKKDFRRWWITGNKIL